MPKNSYPPPQSIPFQTNATTAGPSLVTAITSDPGYGAKTAEIVLTREHGILKMSVYRASTSRDALGMLSRDDHERTHDGLKYVGKAKIKYLRTPIPTGAKHTQIENAEVYTMHEMSNAERDSLRADLADLLEPVP